MKTLKVKAEIGNLAQVLEFVDGLLEELDCPMRQQMQIDVAVEELFVNVASYAYQPLKVTLKSLSGMRIIPGL